MNRRVATEAAVRKTKVGSLERKMNKRKER